MVYDLFRNFAPDSGTKLHSLFLFGTRFRVQSYIPCFFLAPEIQVQSYNHCFFLALESGSLGLKGKK